MIDTEKEEIVKKLEKFYQEELAKHTVMHGLSLQSEGQIRNMQLKLLQTTQLFVPSFDYDLGEAHSIKRKLINGMKKVIRKMTLFITKPYADRMFQFQQSCCEWMGNAIDTIQKQGEMIARQNAEIKDCSDAVIRWRESEQIRKDNEEKYKKLEEEWKHFSNEIKKQIEEIEKLKTYTDSISKQAEEKQKLLFGEIGEQVGEKLEILVDDIKKQKEESEQNQDKLWKHEEAIVNLTNDYNKSVHLLLNISDQVFGNNDSRKFKSYSQAGEDVIAAFLLKYSEMGEKGISYLDIGCNHYRDLNNTYLFYEQGATGVLVDANPKFVQQIKEKRPNDIVLNLGVGAKKMENAIFYILNADGLSSFIEESVKNSIKETNWIKVEEKIEIPVVTINEIMEQYFTAAPTLISLDVEGNELDILQSFPFEKYHPFLFIVETIEYSEKIQLNHKRKDILAFMKTKGYEEYAFTGVNSILVNAEMLREEAKG